MHRCFICASETAPVNPRSLSCTGTEKTEPSAFRLSRRQMMAGAVAALFAAALHTSPAAAAVPDGTRISPETPQPLVSWVEKATNVRITALPITVASGNRLKNSLGLEGHEQARALAAYLPGQIIINNVVWDPDSVRTKSYLVHELVHHAQLLSGKSYSCNAAKEEEAYTLQNRWLAEQGEAPIASPDWIAGMSQCRAGA